MTKICLSIAPATMSDALLGMKSARRTSDLVELRVDGIQDLDLRRLLRKPRPAVIVTNRRSGEGGTFSGSVEEQIETLSDASQWGAEYVDMEQSWGARAVRSLLAGLKRSSAIVSYHNFQNTPERLTEIYRKMRSLRAEIIKVATMAETIADTRRIFDLCALARSQRQPLIAHCMGPHGEISRILAGKYGSFLSFGSLTAAAVTAPGQRTVAELKEVFRVHRVTAHTRIFGLVGNPVHRSKGYLYHNSVFARRRVNAVYVNCLVDSLGEFMTSLGELMRGLSVTMPFKQQIIPLLDRCSEEASALGAVNTVVRRRGMLHGHNTDLPAIVSLLKEKTTLARKRVVVLGTGGTARTMAFGAMANGASATVVGRTPEKAFGLAGHLGCGAATYDALSDLPCDVLMNATPVGMTDEDVKKGRMLVPRGFLRNRMVVFDAVNHPQRTPLLQEAERIGCRIITGAELFERQARLQSQFFLEAAA